MRGLVLVAILIVGLPVASGQSGLILGTEDLPELPPSGPPSYATTYTGARDHDYLEILAGWFSYDAERDEIVWTLKTADGEAYRSPPLDWRIGCGAGGNVTVGADVQGKLRFGWSQPPGQTGTSSVTFRYARGNMAGTGETFQDPIVHRFTSVFETPAYFEFRVNRTDLLRYGDAVESFEGNCSESYMPSEYAFLASEFTTNSADSSSDAIYSFSELRRVQGPDGMLDPIEKFERTNQPVAPATTTTVSEGGTPSAGALGAVLGVALAAGVAARSGRLRKQD